MSCSSNNKEEKSSLVKAVEQFELGNNDTCISILHNILNEDTTNNIILNNLGIAYWSNSNHDQAIKYFNKSIENGYRYSTPFAIYGGNEKYGEKLKFDKLEEEIFRELGKELNNDSIMFLNGRHNEIFLGNLL